MKLYLMRHGPAEDVAPTGRDFDRALTAAGRERTRRVADALVEREEAPRLILSSPLVRALQTAEIVSAIAKPTEPISIRREMAPGGDARSLVFELLSNGARRVMVVGHEPDISSLAASLVGPLWTGSFEKSMVLGLRMREGVNPELRFILEPKTLTWRS
ncbi:MAG: phosphohistidine phosphatase SixA [Polyangiaceae bacterium]